MTEKNFPLISESVLWIFNFSVMCVITDSSNQKNMENLQMGGKGSVNVTTITNKGKITRHMIQRGRKNMMKTVVACEIQ